MSHLFFICEHQSATGPSVWAMRPDLSLVLLNGSSQGDAHWERVRTAMIRLLREPDLPVASDAGGGTTRRLDGEPDALASCPAPGVARQVATLFDGCVWSADDRAWAQAQGWDVFSRDLTGVLEIDRVDDLAIFPSGDAARAHVAHRAQAGDPLAMRALLVVARTIVDEQLHETVTVPAEVAADLLSLREAGDPLRPTLAWSVSRDSQETLLRTTFVPTAPPADGPAVGGGCRGTCPA
jgi:hypothetical protein